jgi:dihydroorotase
LRKKLIRNAKLINEGQILDRDVLVVGRRIDKIAPSISMTGNTFLIDAKGKYLIPGMIDDQVHFREPGLTHKGNISTESAAAAAGGITSFMDMPNVEPQTTTRQALLEKFKMAQDRCTVNYSFYLGATNDNIEEIKALKVNDACGIKAFLGASTGNMLINNLKSIELLFEHAPIIVVTHCEDSPLIEANERKAKKIYGENVPFFEHSNIRSAESCFKSSSFATTLAGRYDALLHVLHLTSAMEMDLFSATHRSNKRITAEVCVHHLWFDDSRYSDLGGRIKCNPAIKTAQDRNALIAALNDGRLDVIATDHAPHTKTEKMESYFKVPSGIPLVQHALLVLFDLASKGNFSHELIVDRTSHAVADIYGIVDRGYVREGYYADLVIIDDKKCGWSPFEGHTFTSNIDMTMVNGCIVYRNSQLTGKIAGEKLKFNRSR